MKRGFSEFRVIPFDQAPDGSSQCEKRKEFEAFPLPAVYFCPTVLHKQRMHVRAKYSSQPYGHERLWTGRAACGVHMNEREG